MPKCFDDFLLFYTFVIRSIKIGLYLIIVLKSNIGIIFNKTKLFINISVHESDFGEN